MQSVHKASNGIQKFPPRIPQGRSNKFLQIINPILIAFLVGIAYFCIQEIAPMIFVGACLLLAVILVEVLQRLVVFCEERNFLESRYEGSYKMLFNDVFDFSGRVWITLGLCVLASFGTYSSATSWLDYKALSLFMLTLALIVFYPTMQLNESPIYHANRMYSLKGMNVGAVLANTFFYGYLKIVLPRSGDRGIVPLMEKYEANEKIEFIKKALYILMPLSMHCPATLPDYSEIMEEAKCLPAIEEDHAGVRKRNYKNSVYKIKCEQPVQGYIYVSAEYATPLKTLLGIISNNRVGYADYYKKYQKDILYLFYNTLVELIESDPETRGLCEIIYFDDMDKNGKFVDIGHVLLKQLKREKRAKATAYKK